MAHGARCLVGPSRSRARFSCIRRHPRPPFSARREILHGTHRLIARPARQGLEGGRPWRSWWRKRACPTGRLRKILQRARERASSIISGRLQVSRFVDGKHAAARKRSSSDACACHCRQLGAQADGIRHACPCESIPRVTRPPRKRKNPARVEWDETRQEPLLSAPDDTQPYNPLDTKNLGIAVAKALLEKKARSLNALQSFRGAGIYALYYHGGFPAYAPIAEANNDRDDPRWPIYIGKAIPPGGRRGSFNLAATDTTALYDRLKEHADDSVGLVSNLAMEDFSCRFLVVADLWIPLAERLLIAHFSPIWNRLVDGFGNHNPGAGRLEGRIPRWDLLHPGRPWAPRLKPRGETVADIEREVTHYLANVAMPSLAVLHGDLSGK